MISEGVGGGKDMASITSCSVKVRVTGSLTVTLALALTLALTPISGVWLRVSVHRAVVYIR